MHEFSICQSIVDTVLAELEQYNYRPFHLLKTHIVVGKLRQLEPEYMQFAYKTLIKDTIAKDSILEIEIKPVMGICKNCGLKQEVIIDKCICSKCDMSELELTGGKELYLASLEVEDNE